jgi:hypothetical protein
MSQISNVQSWKGLAKPIPDQEKVQRFNGWMFTFPNSFVWSPNPQCDDLEMEHWKKGRFRLS